MALVASACTATPSAPPTNTATPVPPSAPASSAAPAATVAASPSSAPDALLTEALTVSAAATSFHVEIRASGLIRPTEVIGTRSNGLGFDPSAGDTTVSGDIDVSGDVGRFTLTGLSNRSGPLTVLTTGMGDPSHVYVATASGSPAWLRYAGVGFAQGLGIFTVGPIGDPAHTFAELAGVIAHRTAYQVVTRLADVTCATGTCYEIHYDARALVALFCPTSNPAASPTACMPQLTATFTIDPVSNLIEGIESRFSRPVGYAGHGVYTFSRWGQAVSLTIPDPASVADGSGVLPDSP